MGNTIDDILANCSNIPEITIIKGPNVAKLLIDAQDGSGEELFATVMPGVTLGYIDIRASVCPDVPAGVGDLLRINCCMSGRGELKMDTGAYFYIQEKELAVSRRGTTGEFYFPGGSYCGMVAYLDRRGMSAETLRMLINMGVDLTRLENCAAGKGTTGVYHVTPEQEGACAWLWRMRTEGDLSDLRLALIVLLRLMCRRMRPEKRGPFFSETQVAMAKYAEKVLTENLDRHVTARALAEYFGVGETTLKNYFRGVYGQNISDYVREKRMLAAAMLLESGDAPVSEVALRVGYANQGKFAAAFRVQFGVSPTEFRRMRRKRR